MKWSGKIAYNVETETEPGVWIPVPVEKSYVGDAISIRARRQTSDSVNDSIKVSNVISIVADPFAFQNFSNIIYLTFMGAKWKVSDVEVQYPRLLLTIGEVYNG